MSHRRVVVTGIGAVAPNGVGKDAFWKALVAGKSGISRVTRFDVSNLSSQIAGEVKDFDPTMCVEPAIAATMGRQTQMALAASKMALDDAGLCGLNSKVDKCALIGTSNPSYDVLETEISRFFSSGGREAASRWALKAVDPSAVGSAVSFHLGFRAAAKTFATSCAAGLNAVGNAFNDIRNGHSAVYLAGSSDAAIVPSVLWAFSAAGMLSKRNDSPERASRPFDLHRDGGVLSEGAGVLVIQRLDDALTSARQIYGEIIGYGESAVGVDPKLAKEGMIDAMRRALTTSCIHISEVDYISAHAPSDPLTDLIETRAIKEVFGDRAYRIPVSSIKSMTGNPQSAAGVLQTASALLVLTEGIVPPTINYENPDPLCDLDCVPNKARRTRADVALVNSHGFNGTDACLLLKQFDLGD